MEYEGEEEEGDTAASSCNNPCINLILKVKG